MKTMKNTIITLYVDTCKIWKYSNKKKDREKVLDCVLLCDNHQDAPGTGDFMSNVTPKSKLCWVGAVINILSNPEDFVIIDKIEPALGPKSFIKALDPDEAAGGTHIDGYIDGDDECDPEDYTVKFSVYSRGKRKKYTIDPRIRIILTLPSQEST